MLIVFVGVFALNFGGKRELVSEDLTNGGIGILFEARGLGRVARGRSRTGKSPDRGYRGARSAQRRKGQSKLKRMMNWQAKPAPNIAERVGGCVPYPRRAECGCSAPVGVPASRLSLVCKKAEQPVRICEKRRNRISFVPPFYGFLRLFTPFLFKNLFCRLSRPQTAGDGRA